MSDNIIDLDTARRKNRRTQEELHELLGRMDELEEMLEQMDEFGVTSRDELVDLLEALEKQSGENEE